MKNLSIVFIVLAIVTCLLSSCSQANKANVAAQIAEIESKYQDTIKVLRQQLDEANDKIGILSFPADQRLAHIGELFNSGDYDGVKKEAAELKRVFPNAKENDGCSEYLKKIEAIEAAKKAEEEKIKALGYKAFKDNPTVKFDNVTYSFLYLMWMNIHTRLLTRIVPIYLLHLPFLQKRTTLLIQGFMPARLWMVN